jgi:hypothetical protein
MRMFFLFISLIYCLEIHSQSIKELDIKNGISIFKTGDDISKYYPNLNLDNTKFNTNKTKYYNFIKKDTNYLYGTDILNILLCFCENKLQNITYSFGFGIEEGEQFSDQEFNLLKQKLENLFGPYQKLQTINSKEETGSILIWDANIIRLELVRMKDYRDDFFGGYLLIQNKIIQRKCDQNDF